MPAPTESTATSGLPEGVRSVLMGWIRSSVVPESPGSLCEATTVPTTRARNTLVRDLDAVDHADDGRVHRRVLEAGGHARRGSGHHQHAVPQAGVHGVDGDHVARLVAAGGVDRAHDQEL